MEKLIYIEVAMITIQNTTWRKNPMRTYDRKSKNYFILRSCNVLALTIALVIATFTFPLGTLTNAIPTPNNPPNIPSNPSPANGSTNVLISTKLNWTGGDPDGNPVKYDIYFGTTSSPSKIASNQSTPPYNPGTMSYSTKYYWRIVAWDNQSASTIGPLWSFTTEPKPNSPPNTPSNPTPANGVSNVLLSIILKWTGGDPDGDPVKYDVYFGTTSSPSKVVSNQSGTSYDPLTTNLDTKYYWKVVAWDNHSVSATGPIWSFTTKTLPTVSITKPLVNTLYIQDSPFLSGTFPLTFVCGPINITAEASSGIGIAKVEFFIDEISTGNDSVAPYIYPWNPTELKDELPLTHIIKVVAYDTEGDSSTPAEISVIKWRFHNLPLIVAGGAIGGLLLLKLVPHTTVTGLFLDVQQSLFSTSFYALRIHYWSSGPFTHERGVLNFKSCTGGGIYGPYSLIRMGPFHNIVYGTFSFYGKINIYGNGFSGLQLTDIAQTSGLQLTDIAQTT
jgi:hypothetical protein